jgi:hypothetical protein
MAAIATPSSRRAQMARKFEFFSIFIVISFSGEPDYL